MQQNNGIVLHEEVSSATQIQFHSPFVLHFLFIFWAHNNNKYNLQQ